MKNEPGFCARKVAKAANDFIHSFLFCEEQTVIYKGRSMTLKVMPDMIYSLRKGVRMSRSLFFSDYVSPDGSPFLIRWRYW